MMPTDRQGKPLPREDLSQVCSNLFMGWSVDLFALGPSSKRAGDQIAANVRRFRSDSEK